jgi:hypothetical protein
MLEILETKSNHSLNNTPVEIAFIEFGSDMPSYIKTIICLANSRKISGRCIAGREIVNGRLGAWVRPVSSRENGELSDEDRRYENGKDPQVLDVIQIPLLAPRPHTFQTENHLIDADRYWSFDRVATFAAARLAVDGGAGALWDNQFSTYNGLHDKVEAAAAVPEQGSLRLIEVADLVIHVGVEGAAFGNAKRKVRGRFTHIGVQHWLVITDPLVESHYLAAGDGTHQVGQALLCVSLSEPFNGWVFKLIAAVIQRQS